jgi:hypothetical protein
MFNPHKMGRGGGGGGGAISSILEREGDQREPEIDIHLTIADVINIKSVPRSRINLMPRSGRKNYATGASAVKIMRLRAASAQAPPRCMK